ncbi:DUF2840 domain-containing protein [Hydrogenophaga sp. Root209]|uniref:DUF2840 domain-containing protein n=1 Tax=Hydrogenophaga sp. Root209 TaxID=1736490 RepID=UPI000B19C355|nr:DUF2840 domain-containing protein [Hydrogenophaga sp. Root209]
MNMQSTPDGTVAHGAAHSPLPQPLALQRNPAGTPPLTRVSLAYVHQRFNLYLRFGQPEHTLQLDHWRRCAVFKPLATFCRVRWQANDHGTTLWQLMVLQAGAPLDTLQRLPGVRPGARLLLHAEGELKVRTVLQQIDAIEAQGIDACTVATAYWCTLGNRLAAWTAGPSSAPLQLPAYTAERHAAALTTGELQ